MPEQIIICRYLRSVFRLIFLWPDMGEDFQRTRRFKLKSFSFFTLCLSLPVLCLNHMRIMIKADGGIIPEDYSTFFAIVDVYLIWSLYHTKQQRLALTMWNMSDFSKFEKPKNFEEFNTKLDESAKKLLIFVSVLIIGGTAIKFLDVPKCKKRNLLENCGVLVPSSTPILMHPDINTFYYLIYISIEFFLVSTIIKTPLFVSYQLYELCLHSVTKLNHLKDLLYACFESKEATILKRKAFNRCIGYHAKIIRDTSEVNSLFADLMFIHLTITTITTSLLLNGVLEDALLTYVPVIVGSLSCLFIACYAGQEIMNTSLSVADSLYNCRWYEADIQIQKNVILMLKRSQQPLLMWCGGFTQLNYPLFISLIKSIYSFLTFMAR